MGGDVLLCRSLVGVCRGDPTRETGHEQSPDGWDRAPSWPPAAVVWALQTEVHDRFQIHGHGGPHHGAVCPVPGQWGRRRDLHTRYDYLDNTLSLGIYLCWSAQFIVVCRKRKSVVSFK